MTTELPKVWLDLFIFEGPVSFYVVLGLDTFSFCHVRSSRRSEVDGVFQACIHGWVWAPGGRPAEAVRLLHGAIPELGLPGAAAGWPQPCGTRPPGGSCSCPLGVHEIAYGLRISCSCHCKQDSFVLNVLWQSSVAVWKSRWLSWDPLPISPHSLWGCKAAMNLNFYDSFSSHPYSTLQVIVITGQ